MSEQQTPISAAAILAKLEEEVAPKIQAIAVFRAELGLPPWDGIARNGMATAAAPEQGREPPAHGVIRRDEFFRMSIPDAIKRYLQIMKQPQPPKAIAEGLKAGGVLSTAKRFYANVTTALSRMESAGVLVNTQNGWGLDEWYAGRAKPIETAKKGNKRRRSRNGKAAAPAAKTSQAKDLSENATASRRTGATSSYQAFMAERRKAGMSLKDIAKAWKEQK